MGDEPPRPLKILYLFGSSRSGSTLVETILGEVDGFFSSGELRYLWQRLLEDRKCGCGEPLRACPLWASVLDGVGIAPIDEAAIERTAQLQNGAMRTHLVWRHLLAPAGSLKRWEPFMEATLAARSLYSSIRSVTGARVIVDSSGRISHAASLRLLAPAVQSYFLHLVRDPRAVAFSQQRRKTDPGNPDGFMPTIGALPSAVHWGVMNSTASFFRRVRSPASRSLLLRYEDLAGEPEEAIGKILELVDERAADMPFVAPRVVRTGTNHIVSGNPVRFQRGETEVREDDEWKWRLPPRDRRRVTALTLPLLQLYGYPLNSRPRPARTSSVA